MLEDIKEYCKKCKECSRQRRSNNRATLLSVLNAAGPFKRLGLGFCWTHTPTSYEGKNYILVITDYFMKWVEVIALSDWTAETNCKALVERAINYHEAPRVIVTDHGTNFTSELFNYLCKALKTKHCTSTTHHTQSNEFYRKIQQNHVGHAEKYLIGGYEDCEEMLGHVVFTYDTYA